MSTNTSNTELCVVNAIVMGSCSISIRGDDYVATVSVDNCDALSVRGEQELKVERSATLNINGDAQVLVELEGPSAFLVDNPRRIRVISTGGSCVTMLSTKTCETTCEGPGLVYAEGCDTHVFTAEEVLIAFNCPSALADAGTLLATGCELVQAYENSNVNALDCKSILAAQTTKLHARDCQEIYVDEGFDEFKPVVHLTNCRTLITVDESFVMDLDGCMGTTYEAVA